MKKGALALFALSAIIFFGCGADQQTDSVKESEKADNKSVSTSAITTVSTSSSNDSDTAETSLVSIKKTASPLIEKTASSVSEPAITETGSDSSSDTVSVSGLVELAVTNLESDSSSDSSFVSEPVEPAVTEIGSDTSSAAEPVSEIIPIPTNHKIQVKNIMQKPELPFGCEIVSLTIVLNHYGFDVDKMYMSNNYLEKVPFKEKDGKRFGADPYIAFPGDPADNVSSGCFAPVITNSANRFLSDNKNDEYLAVDTSGLKLTELFHKYIDNDIPVIIWITSCDLHEIVYRHTWETDDGKTIKFPSYQHCVVLTGYDTKKKIVYIADPLVGNTTYDMKLLEKRFKELGSESVTLVKR